jgi:hypothetical protein
MHSVVARHIAAQQKKVTAVRKALMDSGCAPFAAAYLDASLADLLYVSLVSNKSTEQDLFGGTAPLATFSSRIKVAYYLGLSEIIGAFRVPPPRNKRQRNDDPGQKRRGFRDSVHPSNYTIPIDYRVRRSVNYLDHSH